jgi:L-alanine-DL-glutamate epimerase-like enolase superfamily enzyme
MSFSFRVRRWGGPVTGVESARARWTRRDGALLGLFEGDRLVGLGEATPLAGEDAFDELASLSSFEELSLERAPQLSAPSARFALETALLDAIARRDGVPLGALLGERRAVGRSVLVGRLDAEDVFERVASAVGRGATTLKLKVSGDDPRAERERIGELRRRASRPLALRLDLNGGLDVSRALRALDEYAAAGVELVEEPVSGRALLELPRGPVPWLADESLVDPALAALLVERPECAGFVLKPTLLGGLGRCVELARRKPSIVTHAFEGPVALAACAELALVVSREWAPGLDVHAALGAFPAVDLPQLPDRADTVATSSGSGLGLPLEIDTWGF